MVPDESIGFWKSLSCLGRASNDYGRGRYINPTGTPPSKGMKEPKEPKVRDGTLLVLEDILAEA